MGAFRKEKAVETVAGGQKLRRLEDGFVVGAFVLIMENASDRTAGASSSTIVTPERTGVRVPVVGVTTSSKRRLPSTRVLARIGTATVFTVSPGAKVTAPLRAAKSRPARAVPFTVLNETDTGALDAAASRSVNVTL
jgi:hypothetical protein